MLRFESPLRQARAATVRAGDLVAYAVEARMTAGELRRTAAQLRLEAADLRLAGARNGQRWEPRDVETA
ncbi:MAG TPA: hypothetical protein VGP90_02530 [Acidimicrobiia bacterium]|nr:hypothetical protein [Acidimicrobiia bacterium]